MAAALFYRAEDVVACAVVDLAVEVREQERRVPVEPEVDVVASRGARLEVAALARSKVTTAHAAVLAFVIDEIRVARVDDAAEAVAASDAEPVEVGGAPVRRARRAAPGTVVLEATVDVVVSPGSDRDVVELPERQLVVVLPGLHPVTRNVDAAVVAQDDPASVRRVDPERVVVDVNVAAVPVVREGLAAV